MLFEVKIINNRISFAFPKLKKRKPPLASLKSRGTDGKIGKEIKIKTRN
jgi:transposase-like protein